MLKDSIEAKGSLIITLTDAEGNIKEQQEKNLVVNSGLAFITNRMVGTADAVMSHMAIGTSSTAAQASDTGLLAQASRTALTSTTRVTTNVTNDSVQYVATFGPGVGTGAITEAGIFNDGTTGTMLCRTVFNVVNKDAADSMTITWKIVVA
jgi:hypothetical protein